MRGILLLTGYCVSIEWIGRRMVHGCIGAFAFRSRAATAIANRRITVLIIRPPAALAAQQC